MATNKQKKSYQELSDDDFKRLSPNKTLTCIDGVISFPNPKDNGKSSLVGKFKIYDGFAFGICTIDGKQVEVSAQYPLVKLVNTNAAAKSLKDNIIAHLNIEEDRDVTVLEIFSSYAKFKLNSKTI